MKKLLFLIGLFVVFHAKAQQILPVNGVWKCDEFTLTFVNGTGRSTLFQDTSGCTKDYPSSHCFEEKYEFVIQNWKRHPKEFKIEVKGSREQMRMVKKVKSWSPQNKENPSNIPYTVTNTFRYYVVSRTDTKLVLSQQKLTNSPDAEYHIYTLVKQ